MSGARSALEIKQGCDAVEELVKRTDQLYPICEAIREADRVILLGCGSSYWTAVVASSLFRENGLDATAVHAGEFLASPYPVGERTFVLGYSQSGETTETIRALEAASAAGARTGGITNTPRSLITEVTNSSCATPGGEQEALLATKTVDVAVAASYLLASHTSGDDDGRTNGIAGRCRTAATLDVSEAVCALADIDHSYTLGYGTGYGLAGEAATKLTEAALIHTTALPALEIGHGPITTVKNAGVVVFALDGGIPETYANLLHMADDAGAVTVVIHPPNIEYDADVSITVPEGTQTILPPLKLVQRVAHGLATRRGFDPDDPPSLAKYTQWSIL